MIRSTLLIALLALSLLQRLALATPDSAADQAKPQAAFSIWECNNLCFKVNDGVCDDNGPGGSGLCPYGSDCNDCGVRAPYTRAPTPLRVPTQKPTTPPPTFKPTDQPTAEPTTAAPTTLRPTPSLRPTASEYPTRTPTTSAPTTSSPTRLPTFEPTNTSTRFPTNEPTTQPSSAPTKKPTIAPSLSPSQHPTTAGPTTSPTSQPSASPTSSPTLANICAVLTTRELCCGPSLALQGSCEYVGCRWNVARKKCLKDSTSPDKLNNSKRRRLEKI